MRIICEYARDCDNEECYASKPHAPRNGDRNTCVYPGMEVEQITCGEYFWYKDKIKNIRYGEICNLEELVDYFINRGYKYGKDKLRNDIFSSLLFDNVIEAIEENIKESNCSPFESCKKCGMEIKCNEQDKELNGK